jgi:hypothetical protein
MLRPDRASTDLSQRPAMPKLVLSLTASLLAACLLSATAGVAHAERRVVVSAQVPLVVPVGMSTSIGAGFTPGIQLNLVGDFGIEVVSGFVYYRNEDEQMELDVPILGGINWAFGEGRLRPFVTLKLGYTYAPDAEGSSHWITGIAGLGARLRVAPSFQLDLGLEMVVPDFRGEANEPVGMLFKLGARYALF